MVKVQYLTPREALGKHLASQGFPGSAWDKHFNKEQKEFWYKKADGVLEFIKEKGLV